MEITSWYNTLSKSLPVRSHVWPHPLKQHFPCSLHSVSDEHCSTHLLVKLDEDGQLLSPVKVNNENDQLLHETVLFTSLLFHWHCWQSIIKIFISRLLKISRLLTLFIKCHISCLASTRYITFKCILHRCILNINSFWN